MDDDFTPTIEALAPSADHASAPTTAKPKRKYTKSGKYRKRARKVPTAPAEPQASILAPASVVVAEEPAVSPPSTAGLPYPRDPVARYIATMFRAAPVAATLSERDGVLTLIPRPIVKPWMVATVGIAGLLSLAWYLAWRVW